MTQRLSSGPALAPATQLATFIGRFDPPIQRLIRAARAGLRKVYPTAVYYGASLPDPARRLQGSGRQGRFVRFEGPATSGDPAVRGLLRAAALHARTPLPPTGRGALIIQSISASRRPRTARRSAV
jgi:hypothetical protein